MDFFNEIEYPEIYHFRTPEKHLFDPPEHWRKVAEDMNEIVKFYRGERGNNIGVTLEEMMQFNHGELEMDHDYVQWMFPSNEASMLNCDAPVLREEEAKIFEADPELREKVKDSFFKILDFFGFRVATEHDHLLIEPQFPTEERPNPTAWMDQFNHNMLRVTRVLKCLRLCGLTEYAIAFYDALRWHRSKVSPNTFKYWTDAVTQPLWPEKLSL